MEVGIETNKNNAGESYLLNGSVVERKIGREILRISSGILAKQSQGAVLVTYRDVAVLVTANTAKPMRDIGFFPLTVDYREKTTAAGKFPGGFIKREGRPSTKEILTCRCIDRPIRPLFPESFQDEVQVLANTLSADEEYDCDVAAMVGAFASLHISKIPFQCAGGAVRVGYKNGDFVLMPTFEERESGELDLVVAGHKDAVAMVEAGASELPEKTMLEAINFGHEAIREICELVEELREKCGQPKMAVEELEFKESLYKELREELWDRLRETLLTDGKHKKKAALDEVKEQLVEARTGHMDEDDPARDELIRQLKSLYSKLVSERTRAMVLDEEIRADGRGPRDIRPISIGLGVLPRVHGSAVFTRGETQALASLTLGTQQDEQKVDGLREPFSQRFYLHYAFPPFSVGEVKPMRGPGRREIGHGNLAERALLPVLPDPEQFPYTIRITSDILESNGSSSMATVCAGSLAMMHGGVPIRAPVAGIAMGMISEDSRHKVLSDILGREDHDGDMDFKVTGTQKGITALQMDIKVAGLSSAVMEQALEQAREGRLHILECMNAVLPQASEKLHPRAPRILRRSIPVAKIALLIGPGGKNIRMIQEKTNTVVEVNDEGTVLISGIGDEGLNEAAHYIESLTRELKVGEIFPDARVVEIKDFGAFLEVCPGHEALCHVSELSDEYVENVNDVVKVGDTIPVRVIAIDPTGKVKVSAKKSTLESDTIVEERRNDRGGRGGGDRRGPPRGRDRGGRGSDRGGGARRGQGGGGRSGGGGGRYEGRERSPRSETDRDEGSGERRRRRPRH